MSRSEAQGLAELLCDGVGFPKSWRHCVHPRPWPWWEGPQARLFQASLPGPSICLAQCQSPDPHSLNQGAQDTKDQRSVLTAVRGEH